MAYDQTRLITEVRIFLGGISAEKLPDPVITFYGDSIDALPEHTGDYPYIFWKTTLCCIQYLKNAVVTGDTGSKTSRKEKVGDVMVEQSDDYGSSNDVLKAYDDLYNDYLANPQKFGVVVDVKAENTGNVIINGVNQETVDKYRNNTTTTSIYNPLPVTAFPKTSGVTWRRNDSCRRYDRQQQTL